MIPPMSSTRFLVTIVGLAIAAFLLLQQLQRLVSDRSILPIDDFVEYWAAGSLNAHGENPYDPNKLLPLEQSAGRETDEAVMMWNPPWTLTLAMPFGLMQPRIAQLIWIMLGLVFIVGGADLLWRIYEGPVQFRWVSWLLALTFMPSVFVLNAGQIGTWVLAGSVLILYFHKRGWSMLAGAATVLLAIKPHLVYLYWIALIVWALRNDRRLLAGGLIVGAITTIIPIATNSQVLHQYWEAMTQRPPVQWRSPTFGTLIRDLGGEAVFGLTFLPTLIGLGWLIWQANRCATKKWDWLEQFPILVLVSFVTASYGAWPFDLVILLPAVIQAACGLAKRADRQWIVAGIAFWIAINGAALLMNVLKIGSFWFIWLAPAILIGYLILHPAKREASL